MPNNSALADVCVHPGAAALRGPRVVVGEKDRERLAVLVEDIEDAHIRLIDRQIVPFLEGDSVKPGRGVKDAVDQDVIQLEVGLDLRFVESVTRLPDLFGIKGPVPGSELEAALFLIDQFLHVGRFLARVRDRGRRELGE